MHGVVPAEGYGEVSADLALFVEFVPCVFAGNLVFGVEPGGDFVVVLEVEFGEDGVGEPVVVLLFQFGRALVVFVAEVDEVLILGKVGEHQGKGFLMHSIAFQVALNPASVRLFE